MCNGKNLKPCQQCVFRRDITPGDTGGSEIVVYVGQTAANMVIPCHAQGGYAGKATDMSTASECIGHAQFKANVGIKAPNGLLQLEPDTSLVFGTYAELVAHHEGVDLEDAQDVLTPQVVEMLGWAELQKGRLALRKCKG